MSFGSGGGGRLMISSRPLSREPSRSRRARRLRLAPRPPQCISAGGHGEGRGSSPGRIEIALWFYGARERLPRLEMIYRRGGRKAAPRKTRFPIRAQGRDLDRRRSPLRACGALLRSRSGHPAHPPGQDAPDRPPVRMSKAIMRQAAGQGDKIVCVSTPKGLRPTMREVGAPPSSQGVRRASARPPV